MVVGVLESIVELKTNKLHGYKVITRIMTHRSEVLYSYITDKNLRLEAERSVIEYVRKNYKKYRLFITMPESINADELALIKPDAVICVHMHVGMSNLAEYFKDLKSKGFMVCLDDFYTSTYDLKDIFVGSFDYVFFRDDFYKRAKQRDLEKIIAYFKQFGSKVGFKRMESMEDVEYAMKLGVDLGHGYIFGQEYVNVPWKRK